MDLYSGASIYDRLYIKARLRLLDINRYAQVLPTHGVLIDIGCSRGALANYLALSLPDTQVIGIDTDHKRIEVASKTIGERKNISFFTQDATTWAIPPCNGVVMTAFLHHIPRVTQEAILRKVFDSLEKGGVLLISEVDASAKPFYKYWSSYLSDIVLYFSRSSFRKAEEWNDLLFDIGFRVEAIKPPSLLFAQLLCICKK